MTRRYLAAGAVVLVASHAALAEPPPARAFVESPAFAEVQISPDGRMLSFLARTDEFPLAVNLVVMELEDDGAPRLVTGFETGYVYRYQWTGDYLVYHTVPGRSFFHRVDYRQLRRAHFGTPEWVRHDAGTPSGAKRQRDAPGRLREARLVRARGAPAGTVYATNSFSPGGWNGLYSIDLATGKRTRLDKEARGYNFIDVAQDASLYAMFQTGYSFNDWIEISLGPRHKAAPRPCMTDSAYDTVFHGMAADGQGALVSTRRDTDRAALFRLDPGDCQLHGPLVEDPDYDVGYISSDVVEDPSGQAVGFRYDADYPRTVWFDDAWAERSAAIDRALPGTTNDIVSSDDALRRHVVHAHSDRDSGAYYLYDEAMGTLEHLVAATPALRSADLGRSRPITFEASDGTVVRGYVTVPTSRSEAPPVGWPLVVLVHDGPFGIRDTWGFDPWVQFLASRGYAVLRVNYRGSAGLGDTHVVAGVSNWHSGALRDLREGVAWAVDEGIVDGDRVCIAGSYFGGYAALMSAAESDIFRCVVSVSGYLNLADRYPAYLLPMDRYDGFFRGGFSRIGPDVELSRSALRRISPLRAADRIDVPVLLTLDRPLTTLDRQRSFRRMVSRLEKAGGRVVVKSFENSPPVENYETWEADVLDAMAAFLDQHIGRQPPTLGDLAR